MKLLVGIVTYKPDRAKLDNCLKSVAGYDVFVHDNTVDNRGIAYGLARIMEHAAANGCTHVLTLDQDSSALPGLIEEYEKCLTPEIGAMTCIITDRNFTESQETGDIDWCITSGCLMSVEAYGKTPGYDESLFIDMVDMDICCSLREAGYRIVRIPFKGLEHEVGKGRNTPLGVSYNHEPWRNYYMIRNRVIVGKKHKIKYSYLRIIRDIFVVLLFEKNRTEKMRFITRGLIDAR